MVTAALVLVVVSPVLAVASWLISWSLGRPVFFVQRRPGLGERPFTMIKLRTMTEDLDQQGHALPDQERLTRLGRFLRSTSIDELPELVNVIRGEMSLVGPRPLFEEYLPCYSERERTRFRLRPGITGWAQVNGRRALPWDERLEHDVWYVEHCSFALDLKILGMTAARVFLRTNVTTDEPNLAEQRLGAPPSARETSSDV